ncbi:hypothetical protein J6590_058883 [Homalodisca vitripennis]|nr:hypothetical protein J6590_058883 [Homalodisca vitripennis]
MLQLPSGQREWWAEESGERRGWRAPREGLLRGVEIIQKRCEALKATATSLPGKYSLSAGSSGRRPPSPATNYRTSDGSPDSGDVTAISGHVLSNF